jgi:CBS domain containing-hemolysin-like protein
MSHALLGIAAVVVLVALNAFFVAGEFALVAVDRSRIESLAQAGNRRGRVVLGALKRLSFELSGAQLGITVTSLVLGFVAEPTVGALLEPAMDAIPLVSEAAAEPLALALALALVTSFQMVMGELVPKNMAIARPLQTSLWIGPLLRLYGAGAGPIIRVLNGAANWTVRRLGVEPREELEADRDIADLKMLIASSGELGTIEAGASELLSRTIRFRDKTAADALVPRTSVTALDAGADVADLIRRARETGFSRFPVQGDDLDDVRGVVHVKSAYRIPVEARAATPVTELMVEAVFVPETRPLDELLRDMRAGRSQLAVVIDEYGGTAGIITLEDLLEEIVGEIHDEYDEPPAGPRLTTPRETGTYVVDASLHRDEVLELFGLELPEGPFETLAGYLLVLFDRIPVEGDRVADDHWLYEVVEMDHLRISQVRITARRASAMPEGRK